MSPTKRQLDALRFISGYQEARRVPPSYREISDALGVAHSTAKRLCALLEEQGFVVTYFGCGFVDLAKSIAVPRAPDGAPLYFVEIAG